MATNNVKCPFVLNKCPCCNKKPLHSARNLRDHLSAYYTIKIYDKNQQRKDKGEKKKKKKGRAAFIIFTLHQWEINELN